MYIDIHAGKTAPEGGKMKTGNCCLFYGDQAEVVFSFASTRRGQVVVEVLPGFSGTLLNDGDSVYENFAKANTKVTHVQCWRIH